MGVLGQSTYLLEVDNEPSQTYNEVDVGGHECQGLLHGEGPDQLPIYEEV